MHFFQNIINWLQINPEYAIFISFLIAFSESMIFIGGLIPGSLAITAIGILAGSDIIPITSTLIASIFGAIVGDTGSFMIGRFFKTNLRNFFIFKKYPKTLEYGEFYFEKHGAKSVFLARFIGPIRAIIPAIAGMLGMPKLEFIIADSLSAIGWSVVFFVPGVFIGRGHAQIQEHFQQIFIIFLIVFLLPYICIKSWQILERKFGLLISQKVDKYWRNLVTRNQFLNIITPDRHIISFYSTATEYLFLVIFLSTGFIISKTTINFPEYTWLQHPPLLNYLLLHIKYFFGWHHITLLLSLFGFYTIFNQKFRWLASALLVPLTAFFIFKTILNTQNHALVIFSLTIGLQYSWIRTLLRHKYNNNTAIMISIWTLWCVMAYFLNLAFQENTIAYFLFGLAIGQISWLHARFINFTIDNTLIWFSIILGESLIAWIK